MAKAKKEPAYPYKDFYSKYLATQLGVDCLAEWQFHPTRKWRIDYAFPDFKVGVEIDGGIWSGGRHSGGLGQYKDMEKMNEAAALGWRILHITPDDKMALKTVQLIKRTIRGDD